MTKLTPEREANRCAISARDCDEARKYLEARRGLEGEGDEVFTQREGLLLAAIVSYSRAFINSDGQEFATRKVKVDLDKVLKEDASKIQLHKIILDRRNHAVAHSSWKYHPTEVLEAPEGTEVLRQHAIVDYGKDINPEMFRDMAETMFNYFNQEAHGRDVATKAERRKEDRP